MAEVIVTVSPKGETKIHAEGIQGTACSLHTRPFVNAIGVQVSEEPLPEMFMDEKEIEKLYQDNGGEG